MNEIRESINKYNILEEMEEEEPPPRQTNLIEKEMLQNSRTETKPHVKSQWNLKKQNKILFNGTAEA